MRWRRNSAIRSTRSERLLGFAHARQIDRYGLVVEQARHHEGTLIEFMSENVQVGRHQNDGDQRERALLNSRTAATGSLEATAMR